MISVVAVFNNIHILESRLLRSLSQQTGEYELITIDNTNSAFHNAPTALNYGATRAKGDWLLFAHQDVVLLAADSLSRAEELLCHAMPDGWVGVIGIAQSGELRGMLRDSARVQGLPFAGLVEVQTLDELLLIHRRKGDSVTYFDENVPGWHAYGVEACCDAIRSRHRNYVLPLLVWHDSKRTNLQGLADAHAYVWAKHGAAFGRIYTSCGVLPDSIQSTGALRPPLHLRALRRLRAGFLGLWGFPAAYLRWYEDTLEYLTESHDVVECLHRAADQCPIDAEAFVPLPKKRRRITHRYSGFSPGAFHSCHVVIATDLGMEIPHHCEPLDKLTAVVGSLLVCLDMKAIRTHRALWRALRKRSMRTWLTVHNDGSRIAVLELRCEGTAPGNMQSA